MDVLPPPTRKRVRFSQSVSDNDDGAPRQKKPRFPKGKKGAPGQASDRRLGNVDGEEDGSMLPTNPRAAAKERAMKRTLMAEQLRNAEDDAEDLAGAEEDYEAVEDEEDDGVKIEPFNLKQEREEGYFDAEGNYVEYRVDNDLKDAWLDSVEGTTAVRTNSTQAEEEEVVVRELSLKEIREIKRRIADVLQPGETVLRALRRLKGSSKDGQRNGRMPAATKVVFDGLTEDAMRLMDDGDMDVYSQTRETFLLGAGASGAESSSTAVVSAAEAGDSFDMFGSEDGLNETASVDIRAQESGTSVSAEASDTSQMGAAAADALAASTGYVLDESSGYYYNGELGYYYDAVSGLFCNAVSGNWLKFDEATNSYVDVSSTEGYIEAVG